MFQRIGGVIALIAVLQSSIAFGADPHACDLVDNKSASDLTPAFSPERS